MALYSEPIPPLTHTQESCEKLLFLEEKELPMVYLGNTAFTETCHYYGTPIFAFSGCSDAKVFDQQAFSDQMVADGYASNAASAVDLDKKFVA